jgi:O-methyltransferase involved in polyketide biosynthesis
MRGSMTPKQAIHLGPVQESLLVPLYGRAVDSLQKHPILNDRKAAEMVQCIDWDFQKFHQTRRVVGCTLRTAMFDEWVKAFVKRHPEGTVVEIGAGLNTRFERVDNGTVHWFDLDLPDTVELRKKFFADSGRRVTLAGSVVDAEWMAAVRQSPGPYLFVAEAVFMYLTAEEVQTALEQIARGFPGARIAFDTVTGLAVKHGNKDHERLKLGARFAWACEDPREIERWGSGWRLVESRSVAEMPEPLRARLSWGLLAAGWVIAKLFPKLMRACVLNVFEGPTEGK